MIRAVSFDCAGTLVSTRQTLGQTLLETAASLGISVDHRSAGLFEALYTARRPAFEAANRVGEAAVREFYIDLAGSWLERLGLDRNLAFPLQARVEEIAFGPDSPMFHRYDDVLPCLDRLIARGLKIAVISNWDVSLHRVLELTGIRPYVSAAVASLEFGFEKPDPRIFRHTSELLAIEPREMLHVGDDPVDDVEGPRAAGMPAIWLNRAGGALASLDQLEDFIPWSS